MILLLLLLLHPLNKMGTTIYIHPHLCKITNGRSEGVITINIEYDTVNLKTTTTTTIIEDHASS